MRLAALPIALLALSLVGCKGNSLDGKWTASDIPGTPPGTTQTLDFAGGKLTGKTTITAPAIGAIDVNTSGTYTLDGEKLTTDITDAKLDESKIPAATLAQMKAMGMDPQASLKKVLARKDTFNLKFDSSDQVLLTKDGKTLTLKRVK